MSSQRFDASSTFTRKRQRNGGVVGAEAAKELGGPIPTPRGRLVC